MSLNLKKVIVPGRYFAPADLESAHVLLWEVKGIELQVPGGTYGPKDTAYVDVTAFMDEKELDTGEPSVVLRATRVQQTALFSGSRLIGPGNAAVVRLERRKSNGNNPMFGLQNINDPAIVAKVVAYAEAYENDLNDAPDFDDDDEIPF